MQSQNVFEKTEYNHIQKSVSLDGIPAEIRIWHLLIKVRTVSSWDILLDHGFKRGTQNENARWINSYVTTPNGFKQW